MLLAEVLASSFSSGHLTTSYPLVHPPKTTRHHHAQSLPSSLQVADGRGPDQLVPELLIGFEPLPLLLHALDERYSHLAAFCADQLGGGAIGIKWRAAAFIPAPVKVGSIVRWFPIATSGQRYSGRKCERWAVAFLYRLARPSVDPTLAPHPASRCCHHPHVCLLLPPPLQAVTAHTAFPCGALVGGSLSSSSLCIPNIIQVLAEIREMGQGIVADIVTVPSCGRIGWVV